jgi:hypothetical protein
VENLVVGIESITPNLARIFYNLNWEMNRPPRPAFVKFLVEQIRLGRWQITGDCICILENGKLGNGQHRCEAIIRANITVRNIVAWGITLEAYKVMDNGNKRSMGDNLGLSAAIVSDANLILHLMNGGSNTRAAPQDIEDTVAWWSHASMALSNASSSSAGRGLNNSPVRIGFGLRWATEERATTRDYILEQYGALLSNDATKMSRATATFWRRTTQDPPNSYQQRLDTAAAAFYCSDPQRRDKIPAPHYDFIRLNREVTGWLKMMSDAYVVGPAGDDHPYLWLTTKPETESSPRQLSRAAKIQAEEAK